MHLGKRHSLEERAQTHSQWHGYSVRIFAASVHNTFYDCALLQKATRDLHSSGTADIMEVCVQMQHCTAV